MCVVVLVLILRTYEVNSATNELNSDHQVAVYLMVKSKHLMCLRIASPSDLSSLKFRHGGRDLSTYHLWP